MALSQREKRLLAVPALIAAVFGFYTYVHEPLFTRRAEAAEKGQQVSSQLMRDQARLAKEGNLAVRKEAVTAREQVIDTWVPGKNSAAMLIWYLSVAEKRTGARIKSVTMGERKQVSASQARMAKSTPIPQGQAPQGAAPAAPQQQPQGAAPAAPQQQQGAQPSTPPATANEVMLTVIELNLKVEGLFDQHKGFNKQLEEVDLFLDTKSLSLTPIAATLAGPDLLAQLLKIGNASLATTLASLSPKLDGTYSVSLYFKGEKVGPDPDSVMSFSEGPGRFDPFARAGIEEFLQTLVEFYELEPAPDGSRPLPPLPEVLKGQLG